MFVVGGVVCCLLLPIYVYDVCALLLLVLLRDCLISFVADCCLSFFVALCCLYCVLAFVRIWLVYVCVCLR